MTVNIARYAVSPEAQVVRTFFEQIGEDEFWHVPDDAPPMIDEEFVPAPVYGSDKKADSEQQQGRDYQPHRLERSC